MEKLHFSSPTGRFPDASGISAERILLQPIQEHHAPDIFKEFTADITTYMLPKPAKVLADTLAFIRASQEGLANQRELVCVVLEKEQKTFLGCCGLHARPSWPEPELGIWIKASAHGYGYGREAVQTMAHWAFHHLNSTSLIYPVDRQNNPSRNIAESLGGVVTAEKKVLTQRGTWLDEVVYRIAAPDLSRKKD
jgi:[ribosomal protein S5]-alanine N-acetyltransferase